MPAMARAGPQFGQLLDAVGDAPADGEFDRLIAGAASEGLMASQPAEENAEDDAPRNAEAASLEPTQPHRRAPWERRPA